MQEYLAVFLPIRKTDLLPTHPGNTPEEVTRNTENQTKITQGEIQCSKFVTVLLMDMEVIVHSTRDA